MVKKTWQLRKEKTPTNFKCIIFYCQTNEDPIYVCMIYVPFSRKLLTDPQMGAGSSAGINSDEGFLGDVNTEQSTDLSI